MLHPVACLRAVCASFARQRVRRAIVTWIFVIGGTSAFLPLRSKAQPYTFTTLQDNNGVRAEFDYPNGVALDATGNLYVAEGTIGEDTRHRIRKVTPAGLVSTLAGSGVPGFADGQGATAQFNGPGGVTVDRAGNVYVGDNFRVRKVAPDGTVSTFAGTGGRGFADGPGASAQFSFSPGLAVDDAGNVYVGDNGNHRIRKITPTGVVSTLAGSGVPGFANGPGGDAQFLYPSGVAVDRAGNVYVAEGGAPGGVAGNRIRKVTPAGVVSTLAGSGVAGFVDATGTAAEFNSPFGVAVDDAGNVYVTDAGNRRIRKITPAGVVSTIGGSGHPGVADGVGPSAQFWNPTGIAVDSARSVYVADWSSQRIRLGKVGALLPVDQVVFPGSTFRLEADVPGTRNTYQWFRDGIVLSGQAQSSLLIINAAAGDAGSYTAVVTNSTGSSPTNAATVRVSPEASRLVNMACRINAGSGQIVIPSFFVQGTGGKEVVIRAVGPGLGALGIPGTMDDPQVALYSGSTPMAQNDNWDAAAMETAFRRVGAFRLTAGSKDAALVASLRAGEAYTVLVSGVAGSSGVVLIEVYDADGIRPTSKLTNVSVRGGAGSGATALILGFVLKGLGPRTLLVRGAGPALAGFNVPERLADPELSIHDGYGRMLVTNLGWEEGESAAALRLAATTVGAFPFAAGSRDTAALVVLDPGAYTAQIASSTNNTGEALAEVYEAP